jgi:cystathionine beta-lyase
VHAGTKYLGGHADVLNGIIVGNQTTYPRLHRLWTDMGVAASPDDCFLALRGLRTLALRLERHTASALAVARWLAHRDEVAEVVFPPLPGSRGHALWLRDFTGACGLFGVVLRTGTKAQVDAMLDGMRLFKMGYSWGGYESLILPAHVETSRRWHDWHAAGPYLRLHVGLEDADDLIADLASGFDRLRG